MPEYTHTEKRLWAAGAKPDDDAEVKIQRLIAWIDSLEEEVKDLQVELREVSKEGYYGD